LWSEKLNYPKIDAAAHKVNPASEVQLKIEAAVRSILEALGEDPGREGLLDTPARVARMYQEVFAGRNEDAAAHLATQFTSDAHEDVVIVKDISFFSMCEHHLLPFFGTVQRDLSDLAPQMPRLSRCGARSLGRGRGRG
jgi:GTP cyclohydrolase IA